MDDELSRVAAFLDSGDSTGSSASHGEAPVVSPIASPIASPTQQQQSARGDNITAADSKKPKSKKPRKSAKGKKSRRVSRTASNGSGSKAEISRRSPEAAAANAASEGAVVTRGDPAASVSVSTSIQSSRQAAGAQVARLVLCAPLPANLRCPLHGGLFRAPVLAQCGHTFCLGCIWLLLGSPSGPATCCPVDGFQLGADRKPSGSLPRLFAGSSAPPECAIAARCIPNLAVGEAVRSVRVRCRFGLRRRETGEESGGDDDAVMFDTPMRGTDSWVFDSDGCPEELDAGSLDAHESECPYAFLPCPNSENCDPVRRKDLEQHAATCTRNSCPHHTFGCEFEGDAESVACHIQGGDTDTRACVIAPVAPFLDSSLKAQRELGDRVSALERGNSQLVAQLEGQQEQFDEQSSRHAQRVSDLEATISGLVREVKALLEREAHALEAQPSSTSSSRRPSEADVVVARPRDRHQGDSSKPSPKTSGRSTPDRRSEDEGRARHRQQAIESDVTTFADAQLARNMVNREILSGSRADDTEKNMPAGVEVLGANVAAAAAAVPAPAGVAPVNMNCIGTYTGHKDVVLALCSDPARGLLFSASSDGSVKVWDVAISKCTHTLEGHTGDVHALAIYGRKYLCSGSSDKTIRVWDISPARKRGRREFECVGVIHPDANTVCSLACAKDTGLLFSGSFATIAVFDLTSDDEFAPRVQTLSGPKHWVRAMAVSSRDKWLYSASFNVIQIWDVSSIPKEPIDKLTADGGSIYSLAAAPESRKLLAGSFENCVNVWNMDTNELIQTLTGHIGGVYALCVMPEMRRFYSGSYDSTIKVWNIDTFKQLQTLVRHGSTVESLSTMGGCLFSASADKTVKVWR
jgi:WD40 repeat protein